MASRNHKGHVQGTVPGVSFCGVGWSSSSSNAPTCTPNNGMSLVADGFGQHSSKGYIYFAMGFSVFVEMLNLKIRARRGEAPVKLRGSPDAPQE